MRNVLITTCAFIILFLASCSKGYKPIEYGSDGCAHCKMTIMDARYGAEVVTDKGKVYKFDDILCLRQYITEQNMNEAELSLFVEKYTAEKNDVTDAKQATYLQHEYFASPMNGDYAAFTNATDAQKFADSLQVSMLQWNNIQ